MSGYQELLKRNKEWLAKMKKIDPSFFENLPKEQSPEFLFIGCSDSRVLPELITGSGPGEMFVHRNVGNLVKMDDPNVLSAIDLAVSHLHVKHIIVCGHYGCSALKAVMDEKDMGTLNSWLETITDISNRYKSELNTISDENQKYQQLVELNVLEQCHNLSRVSSVKKSIADSGFPTVHGWVYDTHSGKLKELDIDRK